MQELFKAVERGQAIPVRLQGPIGLKRSEQPWMRYPVVVAIVGGIGVNSLPPPLSPRPSRRARQQTSRATCATFYMCLLPLHWAAVTVPCTSSTAYLVNACHFVN